MAKLRFKGIEVDAKPGQDVLGQLLDGGAPILYLCMAGSCRHCRVRVVSGAEHLEPRGDLEPESRTGPGARLACQCRTLGTGDVEVDQ